MKGSLDVFRKRLWEGKERWPRRSNPGGECLSGVLRITTDRCRPVDRDDTRSRLTQAIGSPACAEGPKTPSRCYALKGAHP
jgi:hypothetical protein